MTQERRKHTRFNIAQAIEIEFPKETSFEATGLDLSANGIKISTAATLGLNAKIFILVQTGEGETDKFYFDGIIAWAKPGAKHHIYGIRITDIDKGSLLKMKSFIHKKFGQSSHVTY